MYFALLKALKFTNLNLNITFKISTYIQAVNVVITFGTSAYDVILTIVLEI